MKNLYAFKFEPILRPMIWGGNGICGFKQLATQQDGIGESWEISDVEGNVSVVANGQLKGSALSSIIREYGAELLGKSVKERFGEKFPLLIKFIDAASDLSIQVHPDDALAAKRHNSFGKTEMWYVIDAKKGAGLYSGFSKQIDGEEYVKRVAENTFVETLQRYEVKQGDVFFLPAGRVHAIGGGLFIAEIQQTSDITYRIYDYNRRDKQGNLRQLHTELAKDAIDYTVESDYQTHYSQKPDAPVCLAQCRYFHTNLLELDKAYSKDLSSLDSFVIYICMQGKLTLKDSCGTELDVHQGESILVPACEKSVEILPQGNARLLEVFID